MCPQRVKDTVIDCSPISRIEKSLWLVEHGVKLGCRACHLKDVDRVTLA